MSTVADSIIAQHKNWLVCHDCGAVQNDIPIDKNKELFCAKCEKPLKVAHGAWLELATALTVTSLLLFVLSNLLTFLTVEMAGQSHSATFLSGVHALLIRDQWLLAGLVLTTIFLYPLLEILALLYVLVPFLLKKRLRGQVATFRYLIKAAPWSMLDVFLLGALVTAVKMGDIAEVYVGAGGYLFFILVVFLNFAFWIVDQQNIWNWLNGNNCFTDKDETQLYDCRICEALVCEDLVELKHECPRCRSPLHKRIPNSFQRTLALLVGASILYVPANLLPIMNYEELNESHSRTIVTGVLELLEKGLWGIAAIVFVASVVVPVAKLLAMFYLLFSVHQKHTTGVKNRALLYRVTEVVGRWSMVDVFVVTLLTAIVQFGFIGVVEPGAALVPFGAVIVLTMLAAESFDPRLIWDNAQGSNTPNPVKKFASAVGSSDH